MQIASSKSRLVSDIQVIHPAKVVIYRGVDKMAWKAVTSEHRAWGSFPDD